MRHALNNCRYICVDGCGWMCTCEWVCTERTGCWSVRLRQKVSTSCLTLLMGMVAEPRKSSLLSMSWSNTMKLWKEGRREGERGIGQHRIPCSHTPLSLCVCVRVCIIGCAWCTLLPCGMAYEYMGCGIEVLWVCLLTSIHVCE